MLAEDGIKQLYDWQRLAVVHRPVLDEVEDKRIIYTPPAADLFDTPERPLPTCSMKRKHIDSIERIGVIGRFWKK